MAKTTAPLDKEEIIWKHYKRFMRKYNRELPVEFKQFVIAAMDEYCEQQLKNKKK